jgi:hypothetical protein
MKTALKIAAGALALSALTSAAFGQTANVTTTGTATIIQPLSISGTNMSFGSLVKPSSGSGAATLSNTGNTVTVSGGVAAVSSATPSRATYTISGEGAQSISVSVPTTLTMNGPSSSTLAVTLSSSGTPTVLGGTLGSQGTATFGIGGTMALASTQQTGVYTGTYVISVAYN